MVFKSPSVPKAINLQDTLHLSSTVTDRTVAIVQNIAQTRNTFGGEDGNQNLWVKSNGLH